MGKYILIAVAVIFVAGFVLVFLPIWSIAQCHRLNENMARAKQKAQRKEERKRRHEKHNTGEP